MRTILSMWHCGDEYCDCWQPRLETRGYKDGYENFLLNEINVGTFHSQPEVKDWLEMKLEFEAAKEKYKPDVVEDFQWPVSSGLD